MRKIKTIIRKEWTEVFKNRMVLFTVIFLPLILTIIPLAIIYATRGSGDVAGGLPEQYTALCPAGMSGGECFQVYLVSQFMFLFMIIPVMIPTAISAYSIVGEKTTRSLEPLLATPITTMELLLGKGLASAIPAILATYGAFILFIGGAFILLTNKGILVAMLDPRWLIAIFIVGPLLAIMAIFFSLIVSSRVNDPRVAEQLSAVLIVPVLLFFFGQMSGLFLINKTLILVVAFIALALDAFLAYLSVQLFQRETILTRWK